MRDEHKEKNALIKSLIPPYTLTIEHKEHKTKELENKSTMHEKDSINSKQTSKANNNMASKNFSAVDSIGFHVNKRVPENDTTESNNNVLLPFPYEDEDLPTQAAVSAATTTTTINSRNNANTNNITVSDTNSIVIQSSTTTTATYNRKDNKNTSNKAVNDSNKLLIPTSASTTLTNNNTNSVNASNSENNTSSKFIPSSIDEEREESEKCGNAAKHDANQWTGFYMITASVLKGLNPEQWKKGTMLTVGDSMLTGLREAKLSTSKRIKVRYFPGGKTEDLQYHLIPYLKKEPDNIIIHIGTNDSPCNECQGNHN